MDFKSSDEVTSDLESIKGLCAACMCNNKEIIAILYCMECGYKFCEHCGNWHRTSQLSKDHSVFKVEEAPPSDVFQMIHKLSICPNHPSQKVIFFCVEEDKLCCTQCAAANHRKCDLLYTIEECVKQHYAPEKATPPTNVVAYFDSNNRPIYSHVKAKVKIEKLNDCYKRISDCLVALENEMKALIKHETNIQAELTKSPDQLKALLQDVHAKIESAFSTLETQLMDHCKAKVAELLSICKKKQLTVIPLKRKINKYQDNMRNIKEHGNDQHMFLLCHDMNTKMKAIQDESKSLEKKSMSVICVEQKTCTDKIVDSIQNMIQISLTGVDVEKKMTPDS
ncbi:hypothetical protein DPMN_112126 [Dreissena polymorpha]|uniref:B box-type domain-containing protein n=1 Tax=Dreissena polymorpha TaxID=45954 RepID=A0A9D4QQD4_DREPO|nr:hypothetical protein DPMN_112126 [Dreissena polymorpha]